MKTINPILKSICLLAAIFAVVEAGLAFRSIAKVAKAATVTVTEAGGAAAELRKTATAVSEYAQHQTKQLMDPRNQKAFDAGIQALAVFNGTGRLINREVIPRAMEVLDNLSNATVSLDRAIQATDKSVTNQCISKWTSCCIPCIRCLKERTDQFGGSLHASHVVNNFLLHVL